MKWLRLDEVLYNEVWDAINGKVHELNLCPSMRKDTKPGCLFPDSDCLLVGVSVP